MKSADDKILGPSPDTNIKMRYRTTNKLCIAIRAHTAN